MADIIQINEIDDNTNIQIVENGDNISVLISDGLSFDKFVTGGTYSNSTGIATFTNNVNSSFNVSGFTTFTGLTYTAENVDNKQNSMVFDGTGVKYPTVDAVNQLINTIARAVIQTGFIDTSDAFTLYKFDDETLGITGSDIGIAFSQKFKDLPFEPSADIVQLTSRLVPLADIGLTGGSAVKFVGYRQSDDSIIFSDLSFVQSPTICQLGIVLVKYSGGTTSFIDENRTFINQPDIAAYSNLETTGFGIKSSVIIDNNGTDLKIKNTGGDLIGISVNWHGTNNDKKSIAVSDITGTTFTYLYPGLELSPTPIPFVSNINPNDFWDGLALVPVSYFSGATVQRFLVTLRGNISVQYGEVEYPSFDIALNNASTQVFTDVLPIGTFAEIGRLVVQRATTDLSDTTKAVFLTTASSGGGGGSTVSPTTIAWGDITGSITDQTDLQDELDSKMPLVISPINYLSKITSTGLTNSDIFNLGGNNLIGIGTVNPRNSSGFSNITLEGSNGGSIHFRGSGSTELGGIYGSDVSGIVVRTTNITNHISLAINDQTKFRVTNSGNTLINTIVDNGIDKLQVSGSFIATTIKKLSGTSTQYLMADGSVSNISGITLQTVYNNSTPNPEILTNVTNGSLTIRRGSASDDDAVYQGMNGAGQLKFYVRGNGTLNASSNFSPSYNADGLFNVNSQPSFISTPGGKSISFGYLDYGSGQYQPRLGFDSTSKWSIGIIGGSGLDFSIGSGNGSTDYITIKNGGNVLIGTSTDSGNNEKLQVNGNALIAGMKISTGYPIADPLGSTAIGVEALINVSGATLLNTAIGYRVLTNNTYGSINTGIGYGALLGNISGTSNVAIGSIALSVNTNGNFNVGIGRRALNSSVTGSNNIGIGYLAGDTTAIGASGNTTPNQSIFLGEGTQPQLNNQTNQIVIGFIAKGIGSNSVVLGNDSITKTALKGNVLVGGTTDNGVDKLQVSGTVFSTLGFKLSGGTSGQFLMADGSTSVAGSSVGGSGIANRLSKWSGTTTLTSSNISDNGTTISLLTNTLVGNDLIVSNNLYVGGSVDDGVNKLQITGSVKTTSSIQVGNNVNAASASNAGSIRYRVSGTTSFAEMSMQTGVASFAWVSLVQNTW